MDDRICVRVSEVGVKGLVVIFTENVIFQPRQTGFAKVRKYLEVGSCRVSFHDGEDQSSAVPCDDELIRFVLGEYG